MSFAYWLEISNCRCGNGIGGRMEGESNKTNILMGVYLGFREKPGARETPSELTRMTPTKTLSNGGEGALTGHLL